MALKPKQKAYIEAYLQNPLLPMNEVAKMLNIPPNTVYNWKYQNINGFTDELNKQLQEKWDEAKFMASDNMFNLAKDGDFKALKYILDYKGFAAPTKVEAEVDTTINITVGDGENE